MQFPELKEAIIERKDLTSKITDTTQILQDIWSLDLIADRWEKMEGLLSQEDIGLLRDINQKVADRWRPRLNCTGLGDALRKNAFRACEAMIKIFPEEGSRD